MDPIIEFNVVPNPVNETLRIDIDNLDMYSRLSIIDIHGRIVLNALPSNGLDVSDLSAGIYLLTLRNDYGVIHTKFVKY